MHPVILALFGPLLAALAVFFAPLAQAASPVDALTLLSEDFPPYNFERDGVAAGLASDILEAMLERLGSRLGRKDIRMLPWARGYRFLQERPNTLLYSVTRTQDRERLFKWVGPVAPNKNVLLARKDRRIALRSLDEAGGYVIGAVRDDAGAQLLLAGGVPAERIDLSGDARSNVLKLARGRIDLFAYPEIVANWFFRKTGQNPEDFESVYLLHAGEVYFALNIQTPDETVRALQQAFDQLKAEGVVDRIIGNYAR